MLLGRLNRPIRLSIGAEKTLRDWQMRSHTQILTGLLEFFFPRKSVILSPTDLGSVYLRLMESQDLHDVMRIEKASFGSPWSQRFFLEEIRVDVSRAWVACIPREGAEEIIGYVCGRFGAEEASILNIAVSSKVRRRGLGRILLQRVISEARVHHCRQVSLEVRRSNLAAQNLYGSEGFITKGIRRHYYSDNGEDALIMVMPLIS